MQKNKKIEWEREFAKVQKIYPDGSVCMKFEDEQKVISHLIDEVRKEQRQELIKEIEGMKEELSLKPPFYNIKLKDRIRNEACDDIIKYLKKEGENI